MRKREHRDFLCICIITYHDTRNSENLTHIFFKNIQMVTLEHHKSISPDFSENAFATELADPAHFVWLCGRRRGILNPLSERGERERVNLSLYYIREELKCWGKLSDTKTPVNAQTQQFIADAVVLETH